MSRDGIVKTDTEIRKTRKLKYDEKKFEVQKSLLRKCRSDVKKIIR